jgi:methyl-accepting chemotaxis protein
MYLEVTIVMAVIIIGSLIGHASMYMLYKKNLMLRIWLRLLPAIWILVGCTYTWARLGGIYDYKVTFIVVPIAGIAVAINFILVGRSVLVDLTNSIDDFNSGLTEMTDASQTMTSISQSLANKASEQASSLEETSSSLEELTAMTRQNSDNAGQANALMEETKTVVVRAGTSMKEVTKSMDEISDAGKEIGKIIKTIDEIAFQTNLLALNAAVEAARAGEAGQGFAVVADEVRNLAQRAAEAAKNTAALIETTIQKITTGGDLVHQTDTAFDEVNVNAGKIADLVSEIAAASAEQAQGIDQINIALNSMDAVTQQNAASAEESASTSEQFFSRSQTLMELLDDLSFMLIGRQLETNGYHYDATPAKQIAQQPSRPSAATKAKRAQADALAIADDDELEF